MHQVVKKKKLLYFFLPCLSAYEQSLYLTEENSNRKAYCPQKCWFSTFVCSRRKNKMVFYCFLLLCALEEKMRHITNIRSRHPKQTTSVNMQNPWVNFFWLNFTYPHFSDIYLNHIAKRYVCRFFQGMFVLAYTSISF